MIIILLVLGIVLSARIVKFVVESVVADDRECLEWYGMDRDFDPEWLSSEECREIVEAFNS